jgi:hypothetical protein
LTASEPSTSGQGGIAVRTLFYRSIPLRPARVRGRPLASLSARSQMPLMDPRAGGWDHARPAAQAR